MLAMKRVSYWYPEADEPAIQDIELSLDPGDHLILAGPSGSGKTTMLWALNGLVPHFHGGRFRGRVSVDGLDTRRFPPTAISDHVGTLFQEPASRFTGQHALDEIALPLELSGLPSDEIRRRVDAIIDRFQLGPLLARRLDQLSGGEQQRVALAGTLVRQPRALLLDEPTSQLDPKASEELLSWVESVGRSEGLSLLIAEQRLDRVVQHVGRMAYMDRSGRLARLGMAGEVLEAVPEASAMSRLAHKLTMAYPRHASEWQALAKRASEAPARPEATAEDSPGEALLSVRGLGYAYGDRQVLNDVCLELRRGQILAVIGENGSGKTTLLRCLMGLIEPDRGEIRLLATSMHGRPPQHRAKYMGYVPQWPGSLLFSDSVEAELQFTLNQLDPAARPPMSSDELLRRFSLTEARHRYPLDLSSGQRQRLALACVLVAGRPVLLLDEPTLGMDPWAKRELGQILAEWARRGDGVIVATHDVEFVATYAHETMILEAGRNGPAGATPEVLFSRPAWRTALQKLTGQPRPASPEHIQAVGTEA